MSTANARFFFLAAAMTALSFVLHAAAPEAPQTLPSPTMEMPGGANDNVEVERPHALQPVQPPDTSAAASSSSTHENVMVHVGKDTHLPAGDRAAGVISIGGSASSDGEVEEGVVAIFGDTHVNGPAHTAVAVFGSTYVNGKLRGEAVAVFGDIELGPQADIAGDVVAVGGVIRRAPTATVSGSVHEVSFPFASGHFEWLRPWLKQCLLYGRPLALEAGLRWAWTLALGFLGLYVLIALLVPASVEKCVATLEKRPGHSMLAALLAMLLSPVVLTLLVITVIGLVLVPFVWTALFCIGLFGKVVVLGAMGRRLTRFIGAGPLSHIAFPVFLGGCMLIGIYLVPVLGFIAYKLTGIVGLGVVTYTLILVVRDQREAAASSSAGMMTVDQEATATNHFTAAASAPPPGSPSASQSAVTDAALPHAGFWIRMAALLIDGLLIAIALGTLHDSHEAWLFLLATYGAVMWKLKGTTVGGILCNLQVVRIDGRPIDWATAIVRALSCFLSLTAAGLGFVWIALDDNRQAWHDKIAGTVVVRTPRGVPLV